MNNIKKKSVLSIIMVFILILSACQPEAKQDKDIDSNKDVKEVEITDKHGKVLVKQNPERVVSLDNRTFETLESWGVKLLAAPKDVMPKDSSYVKDESVENIGNHKEPRLEVIAAVNPDLVIVGQRFARYYEEIKKLLPNATVIDLNIDVSEQVEAPGKSLVSGFKETTETLGKIFNKGDEAKSLIAEFDKSIEEAKKSYNGKDKVMSVVVSGGKIGFSAPLRGRVWGPIYEILGWKPALEVDSASSNHQGDDISVEAIAQSNPDWLMVLDRDAGTNTDKKSLPAKDTLMNSEALKNTLVVKENRMIFAPDSTYTNESIQTFIKIFNDIAKAFSK